MKIAIEGCAHGELEKIYDTIALIEKEQNYKVDLLLCCGDFQATRNEDDLHCMAIPKKFYDMCTFYKYYSGEKVAPILTIFIGGNHEASNYLQELPYGGWVAPNIYYLGYAGCVNVNGIRIAGLSGIYKGFDFFKGHFEFSPYSEDTKRSVYHIRQLEVYRLKQLSGQIDICMSHDWPRGVHKYGNEQQLLKFKPFFRDDIENNKLGSPPSHDLLMHIKPKYWFSAHLHCQFSAVVHHDDSDTDTKFLALDKCLPKRRFLQILDVDSDDGDVKLSYDLEWLTVLYATNDLLSYKNLSNYMPADSSTPTDAQKAFILEKFQNNLVVPTDFCRTVEPYNPESRKDHPSQQKAQRNPQTTTLCNLLGIDDPVSLAMHINGHELNDSTYNDSAMNNDSLMSSDSSFNTSSEVTPLKRKSLLDTLPPPNCSTPSYNPDQVDIDDDIDSSPLADQLVAVESPIRDTSGTDGMDSMLQNSTLSSSMENNDVECCADSIVPLKKKFKRRNASIYEAE
ncbi:lariat debranching enzyme [Bradysia coprophila]|uniref:lariat debranching enzyme n=1 Tax=Bradysia coprophila TaxID=38358 RepID=UPI00187D8AC0|nr:lariat debranching enzyme [Bradysia coprophila]